MHPVRVLNKGPAGLNHLKGDKHIYFFHISKTGIPQQSREQSPSGGRVCLSGEGCEIQAAITGTSVGVATEVHF